MALDWHAPPWELDGIELTPWRRIVWRERRAVYMAGLNEKRKRQAEQAEWQRANSGNRY